MLEWGQTKARNPELLPCEYRGRRSCAILCCFPRMLLGSWIGSEEAWAGIGTHMGCHTVGGGFTSYATVPIPQFRLFARKQRKLAKVSLSLMLKAPGFKKFVWLKKMIRIHAGILLREACCFAVSPQCSPWKPGPLFPASSRPEFLSLAVTLAWGSRPSGQSPLSTWFLLLSSLRVLSQFLDLGRAQPSLPVSDWELGQEGEGRWCELGFGSALHYHQGMLLDSRTLDSLGNGYTRCLVGCKWTFPGLQCSFPLPGKTLRILTIALPFELQEVQFG